MVRCAGTILITNSYAWNGVFCRVPAGSGLAEKVPVVWGGNKTLTGSYSGESFHSDAQGNLYLAGDGNGSSGFENRGTVIMPGRVDSVRRSLRCNPWSFQFGPLGETGNRVRIPALTVPFENRGSRSEGRHDATESGSGRHSVPSDFRWCTAWDSPGAPSPDGESF